VLAVEIEVEAVLDHDGAMVIHELGHRVLHVESEQLEEGDRRRHVGHDQIDTVNLHDVPCSGSHAAQHRMTAYARPHVGLRVHRRRSG
jgi:hypothetical protein